MFFEHKLLKIHILFLCAIDFSCCHQTIENTPRSLTALADMFIHYFVNIDTILR